MAESQADHARMKRNKYSVIGHRTCPCGELFIATTHIRSQRFCCKECPKYLAASLFGRMQAAAAKRDQIVDAMIAQHLKPGQRLTRADLVALGRLMYRRGYQGGYHVGRRQRLDA
jgi:hypothetical protein